ncbi:DUF2249 domain-containing protein [Schaalia vaccimaxillae]|uniref:DUF2249 domain-containing protein n=1 Tax=Schaalia vaccimaxillae TaxID=183916 RepID=UPI000A054767|nr:DUF2249 domain-containing protein [Schaalia vaccimaxillae]
MVDTLPEAAPGGEHQTFKLVDARTGSEDVKPQGGCGCGGYGDGRGHGGSGCGCGGHGGGRDHGDSQGHAGGHGAGQAGGCGCGGHGGGHGASQVQADQSAVADASKSTVGGCGCGGHGRGYGVEQSRSGVAGVQHQPGADELVIHSIPRVVRHAVLFAAVDKLPVGENLQICAPHQPEPLFARLQNSQFHYRVETIEAGPVDWRYRITRLS